MKKKAHKKLFFIIPMMLVLATACSGEAKHTRESSSPSDQKPIEISYCNIASSDLCLEGFGQEGDDSLLILFKADNPLFADIYISIEKDKSEVLFACTQSQDFPENLYCSGDFFQNGEDIQLKIYTREGNELIAEGQFSIQYGKIRSPNKIENEDSKFGSKIPNYPNYPNYPDSSYENPTPIP